MQYTRIINNDANDSALLKNDAILQRILKTMQYYSAL
jgi:hypothetical protein